MSRLFFLAFFGKERWDSSLNSHGKKGEKPHESPKIMLWPMLILAFLSIVGGFLSAPISGFHNVMSNFLEPVVGEYLSPYEEVSAATKWTLDGIGVALALVGISLAWIIAKKASPWPSALEPKVLARAWFIDPVYEFLFARPGRVLATWTSAVFDAKIVDGLVNGSARLVGVTGSGLRRAQNGYVRTYAVGVSVGTALILIWVFVRSAA